MNDIAKEALFRRCADQCDTVEMMSRDMVGYQTEFEEFPKLLTKEEFESELENIKKALEEHNFSSQSFKIHYLIGWITTGPTIHTPDQLNQIFALAN